MLETARPTLSGFDLLRELSLNAPIDFRFKDDGFKLEIFTRGDVPSGILFLYQNDHIYGGLMLEPGLLVDFMDVFSRFNVSKQINIESNKISLSHEPHEMVCNKEAWDDISLTVREGKDKSYSSFYLEKQTVFKLADVVSKLLEDNPTYFSGNRSKHVRSK